MIQLLPSFVTAVLAGALLVRLVGRQTAQVGVSRRVLASGAFLALLAPVVAVALRSPAAGALGGLWVGVLLRVLLGSRWGPRTVGREGAGASLALVLSVLLLELGWFATRGWAIPVGTSLPCAMLVAAATGILLGLPSVGRDAESVFGVGVGSALAWPAIVISLAFRLPHEWSLRLYLASWYLSLVAVLYLSSWALTRTMPQRSFPRTLHQAMLGGLVVLALLALLQAALPYPVLTPLALWITVACCVLLLAVEGTLRLWQQTHG